MSLPRYPEYKDSGVPWLGEVPAHWALPKLKHFTLFTGGGTPNRDSREFWNGQIPWISPKDMKAAWIDKSEECITDSGLTSSSTSLVPPGRVLLVVRSGILKHTIPVAINTVEVALNQDMKALYFTQTRCKSTFFLRWVQGLNDELLLAWAKQGATVESIEHAYLENTIVPLPPLAEQTAIAAFLDNETGKIDALIAEQEKLIALLAEKHQATTSHTVTHGLNPTALTKDSGVAWLGKVPAHWAVGKCGFYLTVISGFAFPSTGFSTDETNTRLLRGINVGVSRIKWDQAVFWSRLPNDGLDDYDLREGDLVIGMDRPLIAEGVRVAKIQSWDLPCLLLQRVAKLQTGPLLIPDYLMRLLSSEMFVAHFLPDTTGVSVPHISPEQIYNFIIPVPSVPEQQQIVAFLAAETKKLTSLKAEAERSISLLKERRGALIAAAVTGQIDVRGAVARPDATIEAMAA